MPILWRYLLRNYFQVFSFCVIGFIAILLVTRFQEIARFATSGASYMTVILFTSYQIPLILGYAIPISCLIAAMLLFQKLSHTQELTAFRACGLGLKPLSFPIFLAGCLLSLVNFTIASEIAPRCRTLTKELIYEITSVNPLFLFQKETLVKLKSAYIDMKVLNTGKYADDVVFVINNHSNRRLGLMTAKELSLEKDLLMGNQVTFISSIDAKKPDGFDHLVIENQTSMSTKAVNLSQFMQSKDWYSNYDYLTWRMLMAKETLERKNSSFFKSRTQLEISKRLSIGLAAFSFTFIGIAFGMEIGRSRTKKGIFWAICLAALFMVSFIIAKSLRHYPLASMLIYFLPHPIIILLSARSLKRVSGGVE
jgi:lipopolysaccharide export system permease protein